MQIGNGCGGRGVSTSVSVRLGASYLGNTHTANKRKGELISCKTNGCLGKSKWSGHKVPFPLPCDGSIEANPTNQGKETYPCPVEGSNVRIRKFVVLNFWPKSKDGFHSSFQVPAPTNFQRRTPIPLFPGHTYRLTVFQLIGGVQQG